jgi:hypothetical protein
VTPRVGDHLRPDETDHAPGVYRVVGMGDRAVLLHVADGEGRRVHTGRVVRVRRDALGGFAPADPPANGGSSAVSVAYWSGRAFVAELARRPVASSVGVALVVAGLAFDASRAGALLVAGGLVLAVVGSGRTRR